MTVKIADGIGVYAANPQPRCDRLGYWQKHSDAKSGREIAEILQRLCVSAKSYKLVCLLLKLLCAS